MDGAEYDAGDRRPHGRLHRAGRHLGAGHEFAGESAARVTGMGCAGKSHRRRDPGKHEPGVIMNRRKFIQATGLFAAATVSPTRRAAAADASAKKPLKKAIMYSTIGIKGSVMEKFRAVKEAGFAGVEAMGGLSNEEVLA